MKPKFTLEELKHQIRETERDIATFSQRLFQAQGILNFLKHMEETFDFKKKSNSATKKEDSIPVFNTNGGGPSSP